MHCPFAFCLFLCIFFLVDLERKVIYYRRICIFQELFFKNITSSLQFLHLKIVPMSLLWFEIMYLFWNSVILRYKLVTVKCTNLMWTALSFFHTCFHPYDLHLDQDINNLNYLIKFLGLFPIISLNSQWPAIIHNSNPIY